MRQSTGSQQGWSSHAHSRRRARRCERGNRHRHRRRTLAAVVFGGSGEGEQVGALGRQRGRHHSGHLHPLQLLAGGGVEHGDGVAAADQQAGGIGREDQAAGHGPAGGAGRRIVSWGCVELVGAARGCARALTRRCPARPPRAGPPGTAAPLVSCLHREWDIERRGRVQGLQRAWQHARADRARAGRTHTLFGDSWRPLDRVGTRSAPMASPQNIACVRGGGSFRWPS